MSIFLISQNKLYLLTSLGIIKLQYNQVKPSTIPHIIFFLVKLHDKKRFYDRINKN